MRNAETVKRRLHEHHLNEHQPLREWATQRGYTWKRLPAVRGSRQSVNARLATAIVANMEVYLSYT